jgi:hypothetical protein
MAEDYTLLEQFDGFAHLRNGLKRLARDRDEWAGYPMPLEGLPLVVEPNFPNAEKIEQIGRKEETDNGEYRLRNCFYSTHRRSQILIFEHKGEIQWGVIPAIHHFKHDLQTLDASDAWGIEQESRAVRTLGTLTRHRQFKHYLLTGMFLEKSQRSGITYMFRRLRPTVAISTNGKEPRILATLCLHPIAYYEESWAGAMCPTDDVIGHLMLMRGDEPMFWRRANQHPAHLPEAGL